MVYSNARFRGNPINPKIRNRTQYNHPRIKYPPIFQNTINESNQFNVLITIKLTTIFFQIHPTITIIMQWYTRLWHNLIRRSIVSRITCNTTTQKKKKISFIFFFITNIHIFIKNIRINLHYISSYLKMIISSKKKKY